MRSAPRHLGNPPSTKPLSESLKKWALPRAHRTAAEIDVNVLVADGLSMRELLVIMKALPGRVTYSAGYANYPTTTLNAGAFIVRVVSASLSLWSP